ncbi:BatD family protein [Corallococcus macrosporus]|uniref:Aerotolerance regulator BatD n=1 Tax=Corallococcus macrosporus DSM 14697 TaxID=1189310 RepID=A0A250K1N0_9BACT|nr:BatD family protein [Corallococcus macrosporus]ATB49800.1 aerotolerance regulator BatD [Corallococcus macrosporus DSM 14697]
MRRTGSALGVVFAVFALLATAPAWAASDDLDFYQTADRTEVGTEDTFRLTVVVVDAPPNARVKLPESEDFAILSRSHSSQRAISLSGGPAVIQDVTRHVLVMQATRAGRLKIPPSQITVRGKTYRTQPVEMTVRPGRVGGAPSSAQAGRGGGRQPDPFASIQSQMQQMEEAFGDMMEADRPTIPRGDSDLFLRASLDRDTVYVGEQVTLSLYIYSRVDLSSVDAVTMPKLEGFWTEEVESPTQLSGEQRVVDGIPYRAYLLRRRAIFPVKSGTLSITPAEADITTGFLFAGHRVHRVSNALKVKVKPLPPGGPQDMPNAHVGNWALSVDVSQTQVELGQPVTVKVILEGVGNVKNVTPPELKGPAALKIYDPTTTDKVSPRRHRVQGRRVMEYLVMPQRTGRFTLPALEFPYFDPRARRYEVARTDPVTLTVEAGAGGASSIASSSQGSSDAANEQKNVLMAGGLRPVRYQARFAAPAMPVWKRGFFVPLVLAPLGLLLGVALIGGVRGRLALRTEAGRGRQQAKAARKRLADAEKLQSGADVGAFYGEVEKALHGFLEARLGMPVVGLTREALAERLTVAGADEERRAKVLFVLEACDFGRYGGGGDPAERQKVMDAAAAAMEGWA